MSIRDLNDAFERMKVFDSLEVVDESSTTFRSEHIFDIRAKITTRFYQRSYVWTGSGSVDEPPPVLVCSHDKWGFPRHKLHGPVIKENSRRLLLVDLGSALSAGDEDQVHFKHRLKDLNGTFEPHIGHSPKDGTKEIILTAILPESLADRVALEELTRDTRHVVDREALTPVSEDNGKLKFTCCLQNPKTGNAHYRISWQPR